MRLNHWLTRVILSGVLLLTMTACNSEYLQDKEFYAEDPEFRIDEEAQILDTVEHRSILDVMARYRQALVKKDFGTINRLVADDYYDNGSTTNTTRDDYGREQLDEIFELLANHADSIQYRMTIKNVEIVRGRARVDYEYRYAYQYRIDEEISWDAGVEVNRVELKRVGEDWRIVSGL